MTKQKTQNRAVLKLIMVVPVLAILAIMFSCSKDETVTAVDKEVIDELIVIEDINSDQSMVTTDEKSTEDREVFYVVETMPKFQGGNINNFRDWVQQRVKYPTIASENGIQGKVFITFIVEPDGTVTNTDILRGVDQSLDNEALRVVKSSPIWAPGKQRGLETAVRFSMTVNFVLQ